MDWKGEFVELLFPLESTKMRMDDAYHLKYQHLPVSLYKYRDVNEHSKQNLLEGTVWLADPETLNDPYECAHLIDVNSLSQHCFKNPSKGLIQRIPDEQKATGIIEALKSSDNPMETILDSMLESKPIEQRTQYRTAFMSAISELHDDVARAFVARMKRAFKLCSFSERNDSTLMWAHYANYHKGFCIEYNVRNLPPTDFVAKFMYPVIYSNELIDLSCHVKCDPEHKEFNNLYPNRIGLRKAVDWSYEKEWRLLFANGIIDKPQAYKMPTPTAVYLGSHIKQADQKEIIDICDRIKVPVKKMQHSLKEYKMQAIPVEEADRKRFW